jgi:hypothetical protein
MASEALGWEDMMIEGANRDKSILIHTNVIYFGLRKFWPPGDLQWLSMEVPGRMKGSEN